MSYSNAHRRAISPEDVPKPQLGDILFESSLRRSGRNFSISLDRSTGQRSLGVLFPVEQKVDEWEAGLQQLSEEQGLSPEGHSLEAARGRQDEPTADPQTTTRTLKRRG